MARVTFLAALVLFSCLGLAAEAHITRGVQPQEVHLYEGQDFFCLESGEMLPSNAVNDDFCDCADGTDEPGTSACAHILDSSVTEEGIGPRRGFYCINKGHVSRFIPTSIVNDGICDCCDGSDEYSGVVECENRCKEAGAAQARQMQEELAIQRQGLAIKNAWIADVAEQRVRVEQELAELRASMVALQSPVEELEVEEAAAKILSDLAAGLEDDDSEDWIREDEESDDEDKAERRADEARAARKAAFTEEHGVTPEDAYGTHGAVSKKLRKARRKLEEVKKDVESKEQLAKEDYGDEGEFFHLYGASISLETTEYTYTIKPFDEVQQGSTSLGTWKGWENGHRRMRFTRGRKCWNAGERETTVHLECGASNEALDVEEPNTCVYSMRLRTPASCSQERVAELETLLQEAGLPETPENDGWF